ncbi:MAG: M20 metallopeptidase family protein [Bacteroidales bacterium]
MRNPKDILMLARELKPALLEHRHHLHMYPELSFQEYNTQAYLHSVLKEMDISGTEEIAGTGLAANLDGNNQGACLALRADMDGLPIEEKTGAAYASKNKGIMHACGHDVHMTCLLGALKILRQMQTSMKGNVLAIFQPGEELLPGGANKVIESGIFDKHKPRVILGQHVMPGQAVGTLGFRADSYMASTDEIYIRFRGNGGHIAVPSMTRDIVSAAAEAILSLKENIKKDAGHIPVILGFGAVHANGSNNIIPAEVTMSGTLRTLDEQFREYAKSQMKVRLDRIAEAYGATVELKIIKGYPSLKNHDAYTREAIDYAGELLGSTHIVQLDKRMTGEDFAYYSQIMPAVFYRLGIAGEKAGHNNVHSPVFDIDEDALVYGSAGMAWMALQFLDNFNF